MRHFEAADSDNVAKKPSFTPRCRRASSGFGSARGSALGVTIAMAAAARVWIAWVCFGATSATALALTGQYLYTGETFVKDYTGVGASEGNYTLSTDKNRVVEFYSPYCVRESFGLVRGTDEKPLVRVADVACSGMLAFSLLRGTGALPALQIHLPRGGRKRPRR
jgi:hypothetical protein